MIQYFWTSTQIEEIHAFCKLYKFPEEVQEGIISLVQVMDRYYGIGRDMDDDGGCVAVITCEEENEIKQEYEEILQKYHIRIDEREFRDILCTDDEGEYYSDLYIVTNDFGVTIIWYHKERA